ncbi:hypothetical protein ABTD44_21225, partial [Acinetobacter baumannii]
MRAYCGGKLRCVFGQTCFDLGKLPVDSNDLIMRAVGPTQSLDTFELPPGGQDARRDVCFLPI